MQPRSPAVAVPRSPAVAFGRIPGYFRLRYLGTEDSLDPANVQPCGLIRHVPAMRPEGRRHSFPGRSEHGQGFSRLLHDSSLCDLVVGWLRVVNKVLAVADHIGRS